MQQAPQPGEARLAERSRARSSPRCPFAFPTNQPTNQPNCFHAVVHVIDEVLLPYSIRSVSAAAALLPCPAVASM